MGYGEVDCGETGLGEGILLAKPEKMSCSETFHRKSEIQGEFSPQSFRCTLNI